MEAELVKENIYSVKIYFLDPIDLLSVIIDALVKLEFETYSLEKEDSKKLLSLLDKNIRNVLFISITSEIEVKSWLSFIDIVQGLKNSLIQIGVFIFNTMELESKLAFLKRGISVIPFSEIKKDTLSVMKKILFYFEAKGKRNYIRTKAIGDTEIHITIGSQTITGIVLDISVYAFSCIIPQMYHLHFNINGVYQNVFLVLKGVRVITSIKLIGISQINKEIYVFKFWKELIINGKTANEVGLSRQNKDKVHKYIRLCLIENLKKQLDEVK